MHSTKDCGTEISGVERIVYGTINPAILTAARLRIVGGYFFRTKPFVTNEGLNAQTKINTARTRRR